MDEKEVRQIEAADFDILETTFVAIREVWKKKILVILLTLAGFLVALIFINIKGNSVQYYSSATLFSAV